MTAHAFDILAELASQVDDLPPERQASCRSLADLYLKALTDLGVDLSVPVLAGFILGARAQAEAAVMTVHAMLGGQGAPPPSHIHDAVAVPAALLAADLLAGDIT